MAELQQCEFITAGLACRALVRPWRVLAWRQEGCAERRCSESSFARGKTTKNSSLRVEDDKRTGWSLAEHVKRMRTNTMR